MKPQLHVSSINQLSRCGVAFDFTYIQKRRRPGSPNLIVGTAVHEAIAANLVTKKFSGQLMDEEQVTEIARDWTDQQFDEGVTLTPDEKWEGEGRVRGRAIDKAVDLVRHHHRHLAPSLNPIEVERAFVLEIEGTDYEVAGTIDLLEEIVDRPGRRVRDWKSSGKSPSKQTAEDSTQLSLYALATEKLDGELPVEQTLDYLVDLKAGPKLVTLTTTRTEADFVPLMNRIHRSFEVYQSGIFQPSREDDWWCSSTYCDHHSYCPFVRHPVSVPLQLEAPVNG